MNVEWPHFARGSRLYASPLLVWGLFFGVAASQDSAAQDPAAPLRENVDFETPDWTPATHGNDAEPNLDEVFEDHTVKRLDIVIREDRWATMLDDMTSLYGEFGSGNAPGGEPGAGVPGGGPPDAGAPGGGHPGDRPAGGGPPDGGPPAGGPPSGSDADPVFVPADVFYEGTQWYSVGVRFKGNSSLLSTWGSGILKLSFKLDFDEFEDDYPQIENQRFHGFKKLSLKNNYDDPSMLREKIAGDVFRDAGLAAPHTALYAVYVDVGEGPVYFGVYTMVEEVDDTVLDTQFADDDGNLYKPDRRGASFAKGTFSENAFPKKNNEDDADWSDVTSLFDALHDATRITDPESWRANLEAVFDTDVFLRYLAVNTLIQNWDSYGRMTHNYYLYDNPETGRLTWIPWDHNEALQDGKMGGALGLDFSGLAPGSWPLIEHLYADPVYRARYDALVEEVAGGAFEPSYIQSLYEAYAPLVEPFATAEREGYTFLSGSGDFRSAITQLKVHAEARATAARRYLAHD